MAEKLKKTLVFCASIASSAWVGFMQTVILHTNVPLLSPGSVWVGTSAAIWFLTAGRSALQSSEAQPIGAEHRDSTGETT